MNHSMDGTAPEVLGDWVILPDDDWLQRNYAHLAESMFPGGDELPARLAQLAIHSLERRYRNTLREVEKQMMLEYVLRRLPIVGGKVPGNSELGGPQRAAALFNDVGLLESQIAGKSSVRLESLEALRLFLQSHGALGMDLEEEGSSQETDGLSERNETETVITSVSGGSRKRLPQKLKCCYCDETFNKKCELNRHFTELVKPCTERITLHPNGAGTQCDKCGLTTVGGDGAMSFCDHANNFGKGVRIHNLATKWKRTIPKFSGCDDKGTEIQYRGPNGVLLTIPRPNFFTFGERKGEWEPWQFYHLKFQNPVNGFKPGKS